MLQRNIKATSSDTTAPVRNNKETKLTFRCEALAQPTSKSRSPMGWESMFLKIRNQPMSSRCSGTVALSCHQQRWLAHMHKDKCNTSELKYEMQPSFCLHCSDHNQPILPNVSLCGSSQGCSIDVRDVRDVLAKSTIFRSWVVKMPLGTKTV